VTTPGATFDVPITFTVYASDLNGTAGAVLVQKTQTVAVAYRPSADPARCGVTDPVTGAVTGAGRWYSSKTKSCYNGFPQTITMDLPPVAATSQVVWTVAYNTSHHGYAPIGESAACYTSSSGCGYDSLNVGVWSYPNAPFSGTDLNEDLAFVNSTYLPSDGWTGYRPLGAITTTNK
jgi:hypothetical protein